MELEGLGGGLVQEKKIIEELYEEKAKNDSNSKSLANLLNILTKTVFGDANRFIFELIQNADDSPKTTEVTDVEVELRLLQNHLVFSHNGKHFTEDDVKGISDVGSGTSGKTKDISKTGYKGIGFKSIFGTCDQVYILSNNFTFKFDKNYSLWKGSSDYPWQVIPLWFDKTELDEEILRSIDYQKVNTVIAIKDKCKIEEEIYKVFDDERLILFLRNIKKITFYKGSLKKFELEYKCSKNGIKDLYINQELKSSWLCKDFILTVPLNVKESIKNLDATICPEKLKEASTTKLTFAALIKNNELQNLTNDLIFCYLPTKLKYNFNYLINGDFITNAERTQILDNAWNSFIFEQMAIHNIKWLAELAKSVEYCYQFPRLIKQWFSGSNLSESQKSFNSGLTKALEEISFIPVQHTPGLFLKINEAVLDIIEFSNIFGVAVVESYFEDMLKIVDSNIKYLNELISLKIKTFNFDDLCKLFTMQLFIDYICSDWLQYKTFIEYLFLKGTISATIPWATDLAKAAFLIDDHNQLNLPNNLYFPFKDNVRNISDVVELRYVNLHFYDMIKDDKKIMDWLTSLGVKMPYGIEIFRNSIVKMLDNKMDLNNAIPIGRFIFSLYLSGQLNDNDYCKLQKLKIITINRELLIPKDCYLADIYQPGLKLQEKLEKGNFVSEEYISENDEVNKWKNFLNRLGVKEKIEIVVEDSIERTYAEKRYPVVQSYLDYIDNKGAFYPENTKRYRYSGQHKLNNFVLIPYIEYCNDYKFALELWKIIINDLKRIESSCLESKYITLISNQEVDSFFIYYITTFACVPGNDENCYKSTDLYSKSFKEVLNDKYPVINDSIQLNKEQEKFLGIKTTLAIDDCIDLLISLDKENLDNDTLKRISSIYKQIEKNQISEGLTIEKSKIQTLRLLATDDTFQNVNELYCFEVVSLLTPASKKFIKIPETIKEKDKLCSILGIKVIHKEDLEFESLNTTNEEELLNDIKNKAKYFATIIANINAQDIQQVLKNVYKKLSSVNFYSAELLSLVFYDQNMQEIFRENIESWFCSKTNSMYYTGDWKSPLTLYSLSSSLCTLLGLEGKDREVSLLVQLSNREIEKWLLSKGYEIEELIIAEEENIDVSSDMYDNSYQDVDIIQPNSEIAKCVEHNDISSDELEEENIRSSSNTYAGDYQDHIYSSATNKSEEKSSNFSHSAKRLISYVNNEPSEEYKEKLDMSDCDADIQKKAINFVCDYELQHNREVVETSDIRREQYIISYNKQTEVERYIKVFGFLGEWNNYDVPVLTVPEMKFAKEKASQFWIYVLEFVEDKQSMHLYCIQDPFDKITKYAFDHGWRSTAESENQMDLYIIGKKIRHNIHGLGIIMNRIKKGELILLMVKFENYDKKIPLNITQMQIVGE